MMNYVKSALLVLISMMILFPLGAAEGAANAVANPAANPGVDFNIRFFDRRIYYVGGDGSADSEPIYIHLTVTNNSPLTYRFKLADERAFSLDFDVRTTANRALQPSDTLIRKRSQYQQIFFREIAVEAGESFSFVEDLRHYVDINQPGSLVVSARLYPELFRSELVKAQPTNGTAPAPSGALESKRLSLSIRPPAVIGPDGIPIEMDIATNAQLVRERLAPDQVIEYMITARQKSQWEKFFLYLDLESMMLAQNAALQRKWLVESEEGRRRMVEQYRQELRNSIADGTISVIPSSFEVERTQYNSFEGTVSVLQKFRYTNFTEVKRYTYILRQKENIWNIVDYSVLNLGTE